MSVTANDEQRWMDDGWMNTLTDGDLEAVKGFVRDQGIDANRRINGRFPLNIAIENGHLNVVRFLTKECHVNVETYFSLRRAILHEQAGIVRFLVQECGVNVHNLGDAGETTLNYAITIGHLETIQVLAKVCDVKATDMYGQTPLHLAATQPTNIKIIEFLLQEGRANVEAKNNNGKTPLHYATSMNYEGNFEVAKTLVLYHVNVEAKDNTGQTPLHLTVIQTLNIKMIELLIQEGRANVEAKDNNGKTPLHYAWNFKVAQTLVQKFHANVEAKDKYGRTPLYYACALNKFDTVQFFIQECHVNVLASDNNNDTALYIAGETCSLDIILLLVRQYFVNGFVFKA